MKIYLYLLAINLALTFSQTIPTQTCSSQADTTNESIFYAIPIDSRKLLRDRLDLYRAMYKRKKWNKLYEMLSTTEKKGISKRGFSLRKRKRIIDTYKAIPSIVIDVENTSNLIYQSVDTINSTSPTQKTQYVTGYSLLDFQVKDIIDQESFLNEGKNIWSLYGCVKLRKGNSVKTVNGAIDAYLENKQWFFSDISVEAEKKRLMPCSYK